MNKITFEREGDGGWNVQVEGLGVPLSVGTPRFEATAGGARFVVEVRDHIVTYAQNAPGPAIPVYPAPPAEVQMLGHAARELASAACELAMTLKENRK